jgi:hypothetical protein
MSLAVPCPPVKPNPKPRKPLEPVSVVGRFIGGADDEDLYRGSAVLEIEDGRELTSYWCRANTDRGNVIGYTLRKFASAGGDVYDLPADLSSCDCPDGTYRGERTGGCRHQQALRQALAARQPVVA